MHTWFIICFLLQYYVHATNKTSICETICKYCYRIKIKNNHQQNSIRHSQSAIDRWTGKMVTNPLQLNVFDSLSEMKLEQLSPSSDLATSIKLFSDLFQIEGIPINYVLSEKEETEHATPLEESVSYNGGNNKYLKTFCIFNEIDIEFIHNVNDKIIDFHCNKITNNLDDAKTFIEDSPKIFDCIFIGPSFISFDVKWTQFIGWLRSFDSLNGHKATLVASIGQFDNLHLEQFVDRIIKLINPNVLRPFIYVKYDMYNNITSMDVFE
eukprot:93277_1